MKRVIVVGGGAAGMCAAISASECGASVTVLERNAKPMKKLRATGNGRGNLMNTGEPVYYGNEAFARRVLGAMPRERIAEFFEHIGVTLTEDGEGRVYPAAYMASVAAEALSARLNALGAEMLTDARVTSIIPGTSGFCVRGLRSVREPDTVRRNGKVKAGTVLEEVPFELSCDSVIIASGGKASPIYGTDGSAYELLIRLGHSLIEPRPALCALITENGLIPKELIGQKIRARLAISDKADNILHASEGEALFAEDVVSGIAAMQLARFADRGSVLHIDMRSAVIGDANADTFKWASRRTKLLGNLPVNDFFVGAAGSPLSRLLLGRARLLGSSGSIGGISDKQLRALASAVEDYTIGIAGTRGFEQAQVTAGGISADEFKPETMESRILPGVYAAGEVLDVDGDCGGFNLMLAFAGGLIAGKAAAGE